MENYYVTNLNNLEKINTDMYVIIRFHVKDNIEHIVDIVDSFDDLNQYCDILLQKDSSLKKVQPLIHTSRIGRCVPMAYNDRYDYYVQFHQFVKEPSFV
jgi:hypothetical protein